MPEKYTIIGHGLAGCVLGLTMYRQRLSFEIVASTQPGESSMASSGLITPVTGRKYVKTWMIDELIGKSLEFYRWTEDLFGDKYFHEVDIIRFLSNHEALNAWQKRLNDPEYGPYISDKKLEALDRLERPYGILTGAYQLNAPAWLAMARDFLRTKGCLREQIEKADTHNMEADIVIHATGAVDTPIPAGIIPNKGEALIVRIPDWKYDAIIKEDVFFVPLREKDLYWIGSYYEPWPENPHPSGAGKHLLLQTIQKVYDGSFTVVQHLSGVRATTEDRRPLVGPYPGVDRHFIFNGMGTKGTSLAPYWAEELCLHLETGHPLPSIVLPSRFL